MEEKEVQPIELKHRGNIGLPFGLCKKFNIDLPEEATPRDAWDALAGKGITPENVYKQLKEQATVELPEKKEEQKVVSSYTPYQKGRITKLEAGQIYKANKNGDIKVLPETIKDLYNEADIKAPYGGYFEERYNQRHYDFDKIYNATRALLNGDYSEAQEILTDYENDLIERAGKKSPYFKYRKNDNAEDEKPVATKDYFPEKLKHVKDTTLAYGKYKRATIKDLKSNSLEFNQPYHIINRDGEDKFITRISKDTYSYSKYPDLLGLEFDTKKLIQLMDKNSGMKYI